MRPPATSLAGGFDHRKSFSTASRSPLLCSMDCWSSFCLKLL